MTTETAKMIFADKQIAQDILGKLQESAPDALYDLFQLPTGWQVVRVKQCPPANFKPLPMPKMTSLANAIAEYGLEEFPSAPAPKPAKPAKANGDLFTFQAQVKYATKCEFVLTEKLPGAKSFSLYKALLVKSELVYPASQTWEFTIAMSVAKKKGWTGLAQSKTEETAPVEAQAETKAQTEAEAHPAKIEALQYA